jgi:hypothetical protein
MMIYVAVVESVHGSLAGAVRDLVWAVRDVGDAHAWDFRPAGPSASDWAAREQPSGWGEQPLQDAYRTGALLWYVVGEQALGVADLLDAQRSLALLSASRPLAESAARCWWLLAPDTAPEERIQRMINDRLYALHEDWRLAKDIPQLDDSWQMATANALIDVAVTEFSLPVLRPTDRRSGWVAEERASSMGLLSTMISRKDYAGTFYRQTSAIMHATLHQLVRRLDLHQGQGDVYRVRLRDLSATEAAVEILPALTGLQIAGRTLLTQAGWGLDGFNQADATLANILRVLISL